jgi:hypothetical protein
MFERTKINVRLAWDQPLRVREAVQLLRYAAMMPVTSRLIVDGERKLRCSQAKQLTARKSCM